MLLLKEWEKMQKIQAKLHPIYGVYNSKKELEGAMNGSAYGQFEKLIKAKKRVLNFEAKMESERRRK